PPRMTLIGATASYAARMRGAPTSHRTDRGFKLRRFWPRRRHTWNPGPARGRLAAVRTLTRQGNTRRYDDNVRHCGTIWAAFGAAQSDDATRWSEAHRVQRRAQPLPDRPIAPADAATAGIGAL